MIFSSVLSHILFFVALFYRYYSCMRDIIFISNKNDAIDAKYLIDEQNKILIDVENNKMYKMKPYLCDETRDEMYVYKCEETNVDENICNDILANVQKNEIVLKDAERFSAVHESNVRTINSSYDVYPIHIKMCKDALTDKYMVIKDERTDEIYVVNLYVNEYGKYVTPYYTMILTKDGKYYTYVKNKMIYFNVNGCTVIVPIRFKWDEFNFVRCGNDDKLRDGYVNVFPLIDEVYVSLCDKNKHDVEQKYVKLVMQYAYMVNDEEKGCAEEVVLRTDVVLDDYRRWDNAIKCNIGIDGVDELIDEYIEYVDVKMMR
jgi:hypothetical protein